MHTPQNASATCAGGSSSRWNLSHKIRVQRTMTTTTTTTDKNCVFCVCSGQADGGPALVYVFVRRCVLRNCVANCVVGEIQSARLQTTCTYCTIQYYTILNYMYIDTAADEKPATNRENNNITTIYFVAVLYTCAFMYRYYLIAQPSASTHIQTYPQTHTQKQNLWNM